MKLIGLYIDQVMALHKDVKHLHIGCDEVYHLGECAPCSGQTRTDVFVNHVSNVANYVKSKYPQVSSQWEKKLLRVFDRWRTSPFSDIFVEKG